ncbi:MAG: hypothetical protein M1480_15395 [Bacteroidetes bacterium]|nr:hypothetical protein [Bacteroidota bacterium]
MNKKIIIALSFVIILLIINGCNASRSSSNELKDSSYSVSKNQPGITGDTILVSNDKNHFLLLRKIKNGNEIWIAAHSTAHNIKVLTLDADENINSASLSPDGKLIAFESDNIEGHSPLTTSHVWVMQIDGTDLRKITQPEPNQRFSTFDPKWNPDGTLTFRGMNLTSSSGLKYLYDYYSNKIEELKSNE